MMVFKQPRIKRIITDKASFEVRNPFFLKESPRPKTFKKVDEIAHAFAEGETNAKARADRSFPDGRIFIEGDVIYSFGRHFPIAIRSKDKKSGETVIFFNKDRFSQTTSNQQSSVRRTLMSHGFVIKERSTAQLKEMI